MSLDPGKKKITILNQDAPPYGDLMEGDVQDNAYSIADQFDVGTDKLAMGPGSPAARSGPDLYKAGTTSPIPGQSLDPGDAWPHRSGNAEDE